MKKIRKGKITVTITIGIMSFILAFVMFMQFKFVKQTDFISIKNMREDELREELSLWKSKYEETDMQLNDTREKINEYKKLIENNEEAYQLIDKELQENKLALGQTDVEGQGVIIYYSNGEIGVTDRDLLKLVNELNFAGAEAISINDQRIITTTEIVEVDSYIYINAERTTSPYVIKVIGNKKYLESGLTAKGGIVDTATEDGKIISVEISDNVRIPKFAGELKANSIKGGI